jgi:WD40 repeat protein
VLHVATGRVLADQRSAHRLEAVGSVAFSPDGALLAVSIPGQRVFLWQVTGSLTFLRELHHVGGTAPLAFQPGGALLATGGRDRRARLFDVATGASVRTINTPTDHLAFSPDGTRLAIADAAAAAVTVWDV